MFVDKDLLLANDVSVASGGAIGDFVNLKSHGRLAGEPAYLVVQFTTPMGTSDTGNLVFSVQTAAASGFGSPKTLVSSPAITASDDIGKGLKPLVIPVNIPYAEQYLRLYVTKTDTVTAGVVKAMLVLDAQTAGLQKQATDV